MEAPLEAPCGTNFEQARDSAADRDAAGDPRRIRFAEPSQDILSSKQAQSAIYIISQTHLQQFDFPSD
jgi:hypothetical protein